MTSSTGKPSSPPPAYTEYPDTPQLAAEVASSSITRLPHPAYGPTPIPQQQTHLLPYYDPRSSYSLSEAATRARWRFLGAVVWAIIILAIAGVFMGVELRLQLVNRLTRGQWEVY
ncbi:hypothetical protein K474DRAFT_1657430 [Panus rudis PR-1116 ss-1]|nr:hypothetical protein K474DRAFT_1657430 [Panus rudis PR-1116 ss-1]